ncbi:MAG: alpha-keto-acid decarboxylase, partial [Pseudonocardiales bacterium]|nr:alpha-keto-acid decarboxylase [Pseudonocardiales bacterium]
ITHWDWTHAPAFFGADSAAAVATRVRTVGELRAAFADATDHAERLSLVQAVVPRDDVPTLLDTLTRALGHAPPTTQR